MAREVRFHPLARADLFDLYASIEERSGAARAGAYLRRIERVCEGLEDSPERPRPRDDVAPGLRTLAVGRRLLLALTDTPQTVTVLRVLYAGRRLLPEIVPR